MVPIIAVIMDLITEAVLELMHNYHKKKLMTLRRLYKNGPASEKTMKRWRHEVINYKREKNYMNRAGILYFFFLGGGEEGGL